MKDTLKKAVTSLVERATKAGHAPPQDVVDHMHDLGVLEREWVIIRKDGPIAWWSDERLAWVTDFEDATRYAEGERHPLMHYGNWVEVPRT